MTVRRRGRQTWGRKGPSLHSSFTGLEVLRSPLRRGPRCGGMEKIRKSPCEQFRPYTSTNLLAWVIQEHACHRPSPSANPPQEEDIINCRHETHQGASMSFLASFFICSSGESGPGLYWDRFVGKCLVMLGAGYTVFPKHDSLGHLNQGLPCATSREEAAGEP